MKVSSVLPLLIGAYQVGAVENDAGHFKGRRDVHPVVGPRCDNHTDSSLLGAGTAASTGGPLSFSFSSSSAPFANATESNGARSQPSHVLTGTAPISTGVFPTPPIYTPHAVNSSSSATKAPLSTGPAVTGGTGTGTGIGTGTGTGFPSSSVATSAPFSNTTAGGFSSASPPLTAGRSGTGVSVGTGSPSSSANSSAPFGNSTAAAATGTSAPLSTGVTGTAASAGTGFPASSANSPAPFGNSTSAASGSLSSGSLGTAASGTGIPATSNDAAHSQPTPRVTNSTSSLRAPTSPYYSPTSSSIDLTTTVRGTETVFKTTHVPLSTGRPGTATESNGAHSQSWPSSSYHNSSSTAAPATGGLPTSVAPPSSKKSSSVTLTPPTYGSLTPSDSVPSTTSVDTSFSNGAHSQPSPTHTSASAAPETSAPAPTSGTASKALSHSSSKASTRVIGTGSFTTSRIPASTTSEKPAPTEPQMPTYALPPPPPTYLERRDGAAEPSNLPYHDAILDRRPTGSARILGFNNWFARRAEDAMGAWLPRVQGLL